jgi:hypothetical protein
MNFSCSACGCNTLLRVIVGATVTQKITRVTRKGSEVELCGEGPTITGLVRYCCGNCGLFINVTTDDELCDYLNQ